MNAHLDGDARTLSIQLANLSARDVEFVRDVCALFTDPARASQLAEIRKGEAAIWSTACGKACVINRQIIGEMFYGPQNN